MKKFNRIISPRSDAILALCVVLVSSVVLADMGKEYAYILGVKPLYFFALIVIFLGTQKIVSENWKAKPDLEPLEEYLIILMSMILLVFLVAISLVQPYFLSIYIVWAVLLVEGYRAVKGKKRRGHGVTAVTLMGILMVVTTLFLWVVQPATVDDSRAMLTEAGYTELEFLHGQGRYGHYVKGNEDKLSMGYYAYTAEKDGKTVRPIVSVFTGEILEP